MATDTLEIFGTEYSGVTGIKATDSNSQTKTYIRPQGTKSISANGTGIDVAEYASVDVNVSGGGGGDAEDGIIERTISGSYTNSRVTRVGTYAFYSCTSLTTVNFPNATSIGSNAFFSCTSLTTVNFPSATSIGASAFSNCTSLTTASFPNATSIGAYAFRNCARLTTASFPNATSIGNQAFRDCTRLMSFYILASSVATLGTAVFSATPMSSSAYMGSFGSIYVPASLVNSYKTATNWKAYSARITSYVE